MHVLACKRCFSPFLSQNVILQRSESLFKIFFCYIEFFTLSKVEGFFGHKMVGIVRIVEIVGTVRASNTRTSNTSNAPIWELSLFIYFLREVNDKKYSHG